MFGNKVKAFGRAVMNGISAYGCAMAPCPVDVVQAVSDEELARRREFAQRWPDPIVYQLDHTDK